MVRAEKLAGDGCSGGEGQVEVEVGMGMDGKGVTECRICQEEGEEAAMDSPCACTGTLKVSALLCPLLPLSQSEVLFAWMLEEQRRVNVYWLTNFE
jgi:hypothetical protein